MKGRHGDAETEKNIRNVRKGKKKMDTDRRGEGTL
jgi:hypothetical protein